MTDSIHETAINPKALAFQRREALMELIKENHPELREIVEQMMTSTDPYFRRDVIKMAASSDIGVAIDCLTKALDDENDYVRQDAVSILLEKKGPDAIGEISKLQEDSSYTIRSMVEKAIKDFGEPKQFQPENQGMDSEEPEQALVAETEQEATEPDVETPTESSEPQETTTSGTESISVPSTKESRPPSIAPLDESGSPNIPVSNDLEAQFFGEDTEQFLALSGQLKKLHKEQDKQNILTGSDSNEQKISALETNQKITERDIRDLEFRVSESKKMVREREAEAMLPGARLLRLIPKFRDEQDQALAVPKNDLSRLETELSERRKHHQSLDSVKVDLKNELDELHTTNGNSTDSKTETLALARSLNSQIGRLILPKARNAVNEDDWGCLGRLVNQSNEHRFLKAVINQWISMEVRAKSLSKDVEYRNGQYKRVVNNANRSIDTVASSISDGYRLVRENRSTKVSISAWMHPISTSSRVHTDVLRGAISGNGEAEVEYEVDQLAWLEPANLAASVVGLRKQWSLAGKASIKLKRAQARVRALEELRSDVSALLFALLSEGGAS